MYSKEYVNSLKKEIALQKEKQKLLNAKLNSEISDDVLEQKIKKINLKLYDKEESPTIEEIIDISKQKLSKY